MSRNAISTDFAPAWPYSPAGPGQFHHHADGDLAVGGKSGRRRRRSERPRRVRSKEAEIVSSSVHSCGYGRERSPAGRGVIDAWFPGGGARGRPSGPRMPRETARSIGAGSRCRAMSAPRHRRRGRLLGCPRRSPRPGSRWQSPSRRSAARRLSRKPLEIAKVTVRPSGAMRRKSGEKAVSRSASAASSSATGDTSRRRKRGRAAPRRGACMPIEVAPPLLMPTFELRL